MKIITYFFTLSLSLFFLACANHQEGNALYEQALVQKFCSQEFLSVEKKKIEKNDDVIYTGLNAGSIARNCDEFEQSNYFLDKAEEAYKYDVDLENLASKGAKSIGTTLLNESIVDYQGTLYERIMVNVYKGLNFMSLQDFENARVEFNRALMRQDKAKEYFRSEIDANKAEFEEAKKTENFEQNMGGNYGNIMGEYEHLLKDFDTTKNFINPYATYMAALFFFLDEDFVRAADLFKEVAVIKAKNKEFDKEFKVFNQHANSLNPSNLKKYIFVVYEGGFGTALSEFSFTIPLNFNNQIITSTFTLPTLIKRDSSYASLSANDEKTEFLVSFDDIVATEFKTELPSKVAKAISSTIVKTSLNVAVAKNDPTGGLLSLATSLVTSSINRADLRYWTSLPKYAQVLMIENTGRIDIRTENGILIYQNEEIDQAKNTIVMVRSFTPYLPAKAWLIQK
ncbi:hypothetical protein DMB92_06095 [Campylobacter sp. MIT 99-7217]|uniref:hypothetical protein n=1 Tax=Campylobacter sp. MIT 99-7217 TaxID=535091 RepID=UPI0011581B40|nr:hypothetical protein [Campylobacter sp. MIT 99-7217]TQR31261.1 hypothetical protein DMB92_06095 [Campylobacter sp. MIT 99-7217]